jgi:hypothetical protein
MLRVRTLASAAVLSAAFVGLVGCNGNLSEGDYKAYRVAFEATDMGDDCYAGAAIPDSIRDDHTTFQNADTFIVYMSNDQDVMLDTGDVVLAGDGDESDGYEFRGEAVDVEVPAGTTMLDSDHDGIDDSVDTFIDSDHDNIADNDTTLDVMVDVDNDQLDDRFEDNIVDANNDGEDDRYVDVPAPYKYIYTTNTSVIMDVTGDLVDGEVKTVVTRACQGNGCPTGFANSCTTTAPFQGVQIHNADVSLTPGQGSGGPAMDPGPTSNDASSS